MEKKKIYSLHTEDKEWLNRLRFYKDEMKFLQSRIEEITSKYTDKDVLAQCEHFSNQLELQKSAAQKLKHAIERDEKRLEADIVANPVASDHRSVEDHVTEREDIDTFERLYYEFKADLVNFFVKWM
jgi:hypothetical protein